MEIHYTPLDIAAFRKQPKKSFDINAIFLSLIVVTLAILAALLFMLIQKKLQELAYIPFLA